MKLKSKIYEKKKQTFFFATKAAIGLISLGS
jgi:hypothetical protein